MSKIKKLLNKRCHYMYINKKYPFLMQKIVAAFRHVNHDARMNPTDFGGQRSKVKVTMDIYGNKLVNTIETKLLCISWSNLADILTMVRGGPYWFWSFRGQRSRSQWTYIEINLWTQYRLMISVTMDTYRNTLWTQYRLNRYVFLHQTWQRC